jgi:hypothetical protein
VRRFLAVVFAGTGWLLLGAVALGLIAGITAVAVAGR